MIVNVELEDWPTSPVVREVRSDYRRLPASEYSYKSTIMTPRQAVFYRNLIRIAEITNAREIPVDFELPDGRRMYLDRGCVKIAEHAKFIEKLQESPLRVVEIIRLAWATLPD